MPKGASKMRRWGQRDLNPRQRVSTTEGATFRGINESSLQLIINCQQTHLQSLSITGARQSARLAYTPWSVKANAITAYASLPASFFFSFSFCAISNAGYRVSSRRVSLFSWLLLPWTCHRMVMHPGGPVGIRTRGVWLRRPALYPG